MRPVRRWFTATLLTCLFTLATPGGARAGVGDPTLETDHPHYAGEGAFQTVERCVARAAAGKATPQDRAIALYLWLLTHQFHLYSPQEWNVPGLVPDSRKDNSDMVVYDANRARFSYAYGLCGTVHAWNEPYWRALGLRSRRRAFPGHTNSEVEYGGSWHAFDTDMAGLVFRKDGVVAGYEDIIKDLNYLENDHAPLPRYPFAWPSDFRVMKDGWRQVAKGGAWYKLYHGGYAAHPGIVHLRSGETFTRYFDPDHFGDPARRRFWHHQQGGPFRDWTFVNRGDPEHRGDKSNSRGNASYCNGEFVYRPDLSSDRYREGLAGPPDDVVRAADSPRLRGKDGGPAAVTFQHFSPYVICGEPADGANPMSGHATGGLVVTGKAVGAVSLEVSADQGQAWKPAGTVSGAFTKDLTDEVKGHYGWQVRLGWKAGGGLDEVAFTTVTQVAQTIYPRLKPGGSAVVYRAASRAVVPVLPDFGAPEAVACRHEDKALRSANVAFVGRGPQSRLAYAVRGNRPGTVAFRVEAPDELAGVTAAARFSVPVPPPAGCDFRLEVSADGGKTWKEMGRADIPADNEYSSGWVYGAADLSAAHTRTALVRVRLSGGGRPVGLITAELYGIRRTGSPGPLRLTYAWKEGGMIKTHDEAVPAGAAEHAFRVPTGQDVRDEFVRLAVP
jgi:hypothetical protein